MSYLKHTPDPSKQWFVLRATYNRQQKAYDYIVNSSSHADAEVYLPLHHVLKCINGRRKRVLEPYLPQLLFVYATAESVRQLVENTPIFLSLPIIIIISGRTNRARIRRLRFLTVR